MNSRQVASKAFYRESWPWQLMVKCFWFALTHSRGRTLSLQVWDHKFLTPLFPSSFSAGFDIIPYMCKRHSSTTQGWEGSLIWLSQATNIHQQGLNRNLPFFFICLIVWTLGSMTLISSYLSNIKTKTPESQKKSILRKFFMMESLIFIYIHWLYQDSPTCSFLLGLSHPKSTPFCSQILYLTTEERLTLFKFSTQKASAYTSWK